MSESTAQEHDITQKAELILQGAMQVFLQSGYAATSMDRVAAQAGVSKHTIYSHFQNKEGLFTALIERMVLRRFHIEFGCELPQTESPATVLRRLSMVLLGLRHDPDYIAFIRLVIAESGRFPELAQLYVTQVIHKGNQVLGDYLQTHPDVALEHPHTVAQVFFGSLMAFILSQEVLGGKEILAVEADVLVEALIQMILQRSMGSDGGGA